jgi:non-homologous end joining protein Ku
MIERKAAGEEIVAAPAEEPAATKAPDLMAALEESIAAVKSKRDGKAAKKPAAKKQASRARKAPAKKRSSSTAKASPKNRSRQG